MKQRSSHEVIKKMQRQNTIGGLILLMALAMLGAVTLIPANSVRADSGSKAVIKKYSAVAHKPMDFGSPNLPKKLEFRFDGAKAWLRDNGDFGVDAEIKHQWLLCGTYQVGIRFGIGSPASCTNVSWVTEPQYISRRKQCNNAWMAHAGNGNSIDAANDFSRITCAQLLIKCTGKCK